MYLFGLKKINNDVIKYSYGIDKIKFRTYDTKRVIYAVKNEPAIWDSIVNATEVKTHFASANNFHRQKMVSYLKHTGVYAWAST